MQCRVQDEYGKLNLNALLKPNNNEENEYVVEALRILIERRGGDPELVDAILDWGSGRQCAQQRRGGRPTRRWSPLRVQTGRSTRWRNCCWWTTTRRSCLRSETPEFPSLTELLTVHGDRSGGSA